MIIFNNPFKSALPNCNFWKGCAITNYRLRLNLGRYRLKSLLISRKAMRFIDDYNWLCSSKRVKGTIKTFRAVIVIIAPKHACISPLAFGIAGEQLHINQEDVDFICDLRTAFNKIAYYAGKITAPFFLVFRSFKNAQFNF